MRMWDTLFKQKKPFMFWDLERNIIASGGNFGSPVYLL